MTGLWVSGDSSLVQESLAIGVVMSMSSLSSRGTAPATAIVTASGHKISVSIAECSTAPVNFTFVNFPQPKDEVEVIHVGDEKQREERILPAMLPLNMQLSIGKDATYATNFTYACSPPTSCLPSPGPEVLHFITAHTGGLRSNLQEAEVLDEQFRNINARLDGIESRLSTATTVHQTTLTLKRKHGEIVPDLETVSH